MDQHNPNNKSREIEITAEDLPLHCPMPSMIPLKAVQPEGITSISSPQHLKAGNLFFNIHSKQRTL